MESKTRKEIKHYIKKHDFKMQDIAEQLNMSSTNFANHLTRETIPYKDVKEIADILGYDIIWKKRK